MVMMDVLGSEDQECVLENCWSQLKVRDLRGRHRPQQSVDDREYSFSSSPARGLLIYGLEKCHKYSP